MPLPSDPEQAELRAPPAELEALLSRQLCPVALQARPAAPPPLTTPLTTPALLPHMSFRPCPPPLLPQLRCPSCAAPSPARDHEAGADHSDPACHNAHRTRRLTARTLLTSPHPARSNKRC